MNTSWYKSLSKTPISKTVENYWYLTFYGYILYNKIKNTGNDNEKVF